MDEPEIFGCDFAQLIPLGGDQEVALDLVVSEVALTAALAAACAARSRRHLLRLDARLLTVPAELLADALQLSRLTLLHSVWGDPFL